MPFWYSGDVNTFKKRSFIELKVVVAVVVDDTTGIGIGLLRAPLAFPRRGACTAAGFDETVAVAVEFGVVR